jgi:hypothetical protein
MGRQPWELQYQEFEFTSLRHAVSTAEKLCYVVCEIGGLRAIFGRQTGPEKTCLLNNVVVCAVVFSGASIGSPLSIIDQANA